MKKYMPHTLWVVAGAVVLLLASMASTAMGMPTVWSPFPIYMFVAYVYFGEIIWSGAFFLILPTLFVITYWALANRKHAWLVILTLVFLAGSFNAAYFVANWSYGLQYQGALHTQILAAANLLGFGLAIGSALWGGKTRKPVFVRASILIFYLTLTWCAFPYLGELP